MIVLFLKDYTVPFFFFDVFLVNFLPSKQHHFFQEPRLLSDGDLFGFSFHIDASDVCCLFLLMIVSKPGLGVQLDGQVQGDCILLQTREAFSPLAFRILRV